MKAKDQEVPHGKLGQWLFTIQNTPQEETLQIADGPKEAITEQGDSYGQEKEENLVFRRETYLVGGFQDRFEPQKGRDTVDRAR